MYSGDTRPCSALAAAGARATLLTSWTFPGPLLEHLPAGAGATLLIHEATFSAEQSAMALRKRHSSTSEALGVAAAMGAYRTVLTHLSARYESEATTLLAKGHRTHTRFETLEVWYQASAAWASSSSIVAYDGLTLNLADLPRCTAAAPPIERFFKAVAAREATAAAAESARLAARSVSIETLLEVQRWLEGVVATVVRTAAGGPG